MPKQGDETKHPQGWRSRAEGRASSLGVVTVQR